MTTDRDPTNAPASAVSEDAFLSGRLRLTQPIDGFRAGLDSLLLAASIPDQLSGQALEVGCGVGTVLLVAALRVPGLRFVGVEKDAAMAQLARDNVQSNGLGDRILVIDGDIATAHGRSFGGPFEMVVSNPPFFDDHTSLRKPKPGKEGAWITALPLPDWVQRMGKLVRPQGWFSMIHRADRLADILQGLTPQFGAIEVIPIQPSPAQDAHRVLVRARKSLRTPLRIATPLSVHTEPGGALMPDIAAFSSGEASHIPALACR